MHLTILSRGGSIHTTRRLVEAARALGQRVRVVDPLSLQMSLGLGEPRIFLEDKPLPRTDVVIPRIAQSITTYGLALVNQFAIRGTPVLNTPTAIAQTRNKMRLMQLLTSNGIPVPAAVMGRGAGQLRGMAKLVGGLPVAIKLVHGADRYGIIVCETEQSLEAALEAILSMGHEIIVQSYLKPGEGRDLRALVVGDEVIAAVKRQAPMGKLRHSLSTGARLTRARLTPEQRETAVRAVRVVGLEVGAVDLLEHDGVTQVFEVHSSPGLGELESTTGDDLAKPIIRRAMALAQEAKARPAEARRRPARRAAGGATGKR